MARWLTFLCLLIFIIKVNHYGQKITTEELIKRAKVVHGDFQQLPFSHLNGQTCKKCDNEEKFIEKAKGVQHYADIEIQGRKNYKYIHDLLIKTCMKIIVKIKN